MSREPAESQKPLWTLLVVVSVLYVLSVPWVLAFGDKRVPDQLLEAYCTPYGFLADIPYMGKPLHDYLLWCSHKAHRGPFYVPNE